jgi:hypothetical protein
MKVTMLRAGDKILKDLIFIRFCGLVGNCFIPGSSYGVGDRLSCLLFCGNAAVAPKPLYFLPLLQVCQSSVQVILQHVQ